MRDQAYDAYARLALQLKGNFEQFQNKLKEYFEKEHAGGEHIVRVEIFYKVLKMFRAHIKEEDRDKI